MAKHRRRDPNQEIINLIHVYNCLIERESDAINGRVSSLTRNVSRMLRHGHVIYR